MGFSSPVFRGRLRASFTLRLIAELFFDSPEGEDLMQILHAKTPADFCWRDAVFQRETYF
jgi:hypothetical protein